MKSSYSASDDEPAHFRDRFALRNRDFLLMGIVLLLVGVWVYARGNRAYEGTLGRPLRVGIVSWPGYAGGLVANKGLRPNKDSYFWNKHSLLVEFVLVEDETELHDEFVKGELDIVWSTVDSLAQQAAAFEKEGVQPRAFMQVDWSRGGDAIIADADVDRIEGLREKHIAVSMSASLWLLEYSLENSSLSDDERRTIRQTRVSTQGSPDAGKRFVSGNVDAAVLWEPDVAEALRGRPGSKILVDTTTAANLIADVMVARQEFIKHRSDVIRAFIDGWFYGTTEAIRDPMLAVKVLQYEPEFAALGEEKTRELIGKTAWATLGDNAEMFALSGVGRVFFDDLFNRASHLWSKDYNTETIPAERARDIGLLKEFYRARLQSSPPKPGCDPGTENLQTISLAVPFAAGRAEISEEARTILDNQEALFMLQTHTGARFCVRAEPVEGDDAQRVLEVSRARENAIIEYLAKHYNRPWSQFVSASADTSDKASNGATTQYIRLKLISARKRQ
jgi:NitT/TauT family transport system substrate-binding protein